MACNYCSTGCPRCVPGWVAQRKGNAALKNFQLSDPIAEECVDPRELHNFFEKNEYVPYAGYRHDSQHTVLRFIDNLATLSPTLGGVINTLTHHCFGGKAMIRRIVDPDFDIGEESPELPGEVRKNYIAWLRTIDLGQRDWSSLRVGLFRSLKANGNAWLEVSIAQSMGGNKVVLTCHQTKNTLYRIPELYAPRSVAISKSWDKKYLKKYPPDILPVFPHYETTKDGTIRTMIHVRLGDNDFYGRPDWWPCAHDAFLEIKNKEYLLKAAHNNFTGKVLIEFADDLGNNTATNDEEARKAGFSNSHDRWIHNFTDQGDEPTSVLMSSRPMAATPAFVHEFNINTQHEYYKVMDEIATNKIIVTNGWSRKLMGLDSATGLSTSAFIDELRTKLPIIEYYQGIIDNELINCALGFCAQITGRLDFVEYGIESKNPFDHLLNAQKRAE